MLPSPPSPHLPRTVAADAKGLEAAGARVRALQARLNATLIETHISWVLVAGDDAWKLKKPLRLPFLDAHELATRQWLCEEECRLNRRLAPELYLGVTAIGGPPDAPVLLGDALPGGATVGAAEHAVHMRAFAADALFSERLRAGRLQAAHIDRLVRRLGRFHREQASRTPPEPTLGDADQVEASLRHVLRDLLAFTPPGTEAAALARRLQDWLDDEAPRLRPLWAARHAQGHIVEGHGDLHLANLIVLPDDDATAFDGIDFDPALRWIDPVSDIAFLVMDLLAHGRADFAWRALSAWLDETGEHAGVPTLRAYLVYRAAVRAMVAAVRAQQSAPTVASQAVPTPPPGPDYLALAHRLTDPFAHGMRTPRLLLTVGLSGSGKSWHSQRLLMQAGAIRLRSDVERKRLFGLSPWATTSPTTSSPTSAAPPLPPQGLYGPDTTAATYATLLQRAETLLQAGWPVIVDAASLRRAERAPFQALAARLHLPFTLLWCEAPEAVRHQRVAQRQQAGQDPSEADTTLLPRQATWWEPFTADEQPHVLAATTADNPDDAGQSLAQQWLNATATPPPA